MKFHIHTHMHARMITRNITCYNFNGIVHVEDTVLVIP